jgi:hypothetical protein
MIQGATMLTKLKYALAAAALATAPMSANALSFYSDIAAGGTYEVGTGFKKITAVANGPEGSNSFTVELANNLASTHTVGFGTQYFSSTLPGLSISDGVNTYTGAFSVALAAGATQTITVSYAALSGGENLGVVMSSVPLPAGGALLLSALGLGFVARRRKASKEAALA